MAMRGIADSIIGVCPNKFILTLVVGFINYAENAEQKMAFIID
jgi:hypothetical protein